MRDEAKANDLESPLITFAVRIVNVATALPRTPVGRHLADQLPRAGTSPAPNYAEARGSESRADFAHKLKIAFKELNETRVWLRIASEAGLIKPTKLAPLLDENAQLCRIINTSITTARQTRRQANQSPNDQ